MAGEIDERAIHAVTGRSPSMNSQNHLTIPMDWESLDLSGLHGGLMVIGARDTGSLSWTAIRVRPAWVPRLP
jgi:hypothetical protein